MSTPLRTIIPVVKCKELGRSLVFYTEVLDFERKYPEESIECGVVNVIKDGAELQLSIHRDDGVLGCAINVLVRDVDRLFAVYVNRGLDVSSRKNSPVHSGPTDQTWGMREFYATDPDGNILRFGTPIT